MSEPVILDLTPGQVPGLRFWVTTRHGGVSNGPFASLNLSLSVSDDPAAVQENRRRVLAALGLRADRVVGAEQTHGDGVAVVTPADGGRGIAPGVPPVPGVDALITAEPGLFILVQVADCYPVAVFDRRRQVVGLAHCGWRGTLAGLPAKLVRAMADTFGSRPDDLLAVIGPGIGPCCYEVGPDVAEEARLRLPMPEEAVNLRAGRTYLDLPAAVVQQLRAAGVPGAQIFGRAMCTACNTTTFYSHRAARGPTGRFWAIAGRPVA